MEQIAIAASEACKYCSNTDLDLYTNIENAKRLFCKACQQHDCTRTLDYSPAGLEQLRYVKRDYPSEAEQAEIADYAERIAKNRGRDEIHADDVITAMATLHEFRQRQERRKRILPAECSKVRINNAGYDDQGRYFGHDGDNIYLVTCDDTDLIEYVRAPDRQTACERIQRWTRPQGRLKFKGIPLPR